MTARGAKRSISGRNIPESQRHTVKLQVRISPAARSKLDALCDDSGFGLSEQVEALIDAEHDLELIPKRGRRKS